MLSDLHVSDRSILLTIQLAHLIQFLLNQNEKYRNAMHSVLIVMNHLNQQVQISVGPFTLGVHTLEIL